jgi:hypothetical protein
MCVSFVRGSSEREEVWCWFQFVLKGMVALKYLNALLPLLSRDSLAAVNAFDGKKFTNKELVF